jgi:hypothetical protein
MLGKVNGQCKSGRFAILARRLGASIVLGVLLVALGGGHLAVAQTSDQVIFDDQLNWENLSWWTTTEIEGTSPVFQGSNSLAVTYHQGWAGLYLRSPGFDTSDFTHLQFALHPDGNSLPAINASLHDENNSIVQRASIQSYAAAGAGGWHMVTIPLEDLDGTNQTITRVLLQNASTQAQPTFFIDEWGFVAEIGGAPIDNGEATFTVTTTEPGNDINPGDGLCEDQQGRCTLQAAVQEANALNASVTIVVPAGTYAPSSLMSPDVEDNCDPFMRCYRLAFASGGSVHLIGAGHNQTFIEGNNRPVIWVVEGAEVEIEGVTIRRGSNNTGHGGGIFNQGVLVLHDSALTDNIDIEGAGGILNMGTATLWHMRILNNQSGFTGQGSGGGIGNYGTMTLTHSLVRGNSANMAGGGINNRGSLTIRDVGIINNSAGPTGGGGIGSVATFTTSEAVGAPRLDILRVLVGGNTTSGTGGGIAAQLGTHIIDSTIAGNRASRGAGISGSALLEDVVIRDNIAQENGGGILVGEEVILGSSQVINNGPNDCSEPVAQATGASADSDGTCLLGGDG